MPERSSNSVRIHYPTNKKKILKIANVICEKYCQDLGLNLLVIFGSYAKDTFSKGSDVDCLIVTRYDKDDTYFALARESVRHKGVHFEFHVYKQEEYDRMKDEQHPFIMQALDEGIVIYKREES